MIRALIEFGLVPDVISAVSVGALNGVVIAQDPSLAGVKRLEEVWRGTDAKTLFPGSSLHKTLAALRRGDHICDNAGIRSLIERHVRVEVFEDLKLPLYVTICELANGAPHVFHTGPLSNVLLATTALPGVFPPVEVDGVLMVDGGIVSNIPTAPVVAVRPEQLFVLDVSRPLGTNRFARTPLGVMVQVFNIARSQCASRDLEAAQSLSGAVVLPRPDDAPLLAYDDTSRTEELMEVGYRRTRRFLEEEWSEPVAPSAQRTRLG